MGINNQTPREEQLHKTNHITIPIQSKMSSGNPGNFANRPHEQVEDIARKGGQSSHNSGFAHMDESKQKDIASQGGHASGGSFRPGDPRAREAGHKGGMRVASISRMSNVS